MAYLGGYRQPKVIADPVYGKMIDITPVLPLVETPEFQTLADKLQLGMTFLVFRSATHTRFNHCVGAYYVTRLLVDQWLLDGVISRVERDAIAGYALIHDIGHPPFSHVVEDFCELDDDEMTLHLIRTKLRVAIEACGIDPELLESLADHSNPLYLTVHDKNFGAEKRDYLVRDGMHTTMNIPTGIKYLQEYLYFVDGQLVIDEKVVDAAMHVQNFYISMYKTVYLRKALVIAHRMFHKMVHHLMLAGELTREELPAMTDTELIARMIQSASPTVRNLYQRWRNRKLFCEAIVLRPESFTHETRIWNKPITVFGLAPEQMECLISSPKLQKQNHEWVEQLEDRIGDEVGIPKGEILVVPVFDSYRFQAKDVSIYESDGKLHSLRERRPAHFRAMEETARSYTALRICTSTEYREKLSRPAVAEIVSELVMSEL